MTDTFGKLQVPVPVTEDPRGEAVGDPLLDLIGAYFQAVLNADIGDAWGTIFPARAANGASAPSLPVPRFFTHDPDEASFSSKNTPCLYVYQPDQPEPQRIRATLGWEVVRRPIAVMLVPPPPNQEKQRLRSGIRNAVDKAIRRAVRTMRHPGWVVDDDPDENAPDLGSQFIRHAKLQAWSLPNGVKRQPLVIEDEEGNKGTPFPALLATLLVDECLVRGTDGYAELADVRGAITVNGLELQAYRYLVQLASIDPTSGPLTGGTTITFNGAQFAEEGMVATIDGKACTDLAFVDEGTLTAVSPAGASAGAKDVVLTAPSGASSKLVGAFTYTP